MRLDKRVARVVGKASLGMLVALVFLLLLEGLSSVFFFGRHTLQELAKEAVFTQHDDELGWTSQPNIHIDDMYGPGRDVRTNSVGLRNTPEFEWALPPGRLRIVCSGDSYTFGHGVGNERAWPAVLAALEPRFEVLNLGQTGYGVDQAFLKYRARQKEWQHDIHLFAFITDDFRRMQYAEFLGYAKPLLEVVDGEVRVTNRPVPGRPPYFAQWAIVMRRIEELSLVKLLRSMAGRPRTRERTVNADRMDDTGRELAGQIFEELHELSDDNGSLPVLVYLPAGAWDYHEAPGSPTEHWRYFFEHESQERGWIFVDLVAALRKLPHHEIGELFEDHYSEKGNEFVARALLENLQRDRRVQERMERRLGVESWSQESQSD